jgi:hypothetical protein
VRRNRPDRHRLASVIGETTFGAARRSAGAGAARHRVESQFCAKESKMKKLLTIVFAIFLLASFSLAAQDTTNQDNMKAGTSMKAASITGKVSDDGKSFVSDKDGKSWTISNPDAVKGHEGHHVTLKAHVSADTNQVEVVSLKMAGDKMKKDSSPN